MPLHPVHQLAQQAALSIFRAHGDVIHPDSLSELKSLLPNSTPKTATPRIESVVRLARSAADLDRFYTQWRDQLPEGIQGQFPDVHLPVTVKAFTTPADIDHLPSSREIFFLSVGHEDYDLSTLVHELIHWLAHRDYIANVVNDRPDNIPRDSWHELIHEGITDWLAREALREKPSIDWYFLAPPQPGQQFFVNSYSPARDTLSSLTAITPLTAETYRRAVLRGDLNATKLLRGSLIAAKQIQTGETVSRLDTTMDRAIGYTLSRIQERVQQLQSVSPPEDQAVPQDLAQNPAIEHAGNPALNTG